MRAGSTTSRGAVALAIDIGPLDVFHLQRAGIQPARSDQGRPSSSTWLLIGVEFRELSMDEDRIPLVKAVVRGSSVEEAQAFVAEARTLEDASEVTELLWTRLEGRFSTEFEGSPREAAPSRWAQRLWGAKSVSRRHDRDLAEVPPGPFRTPTGRLQSMCRRRRARSRIAPPSGSWLSGENTGAAGASPFHRGGVTDARDGIAERPNAHTITPNTVIHSPTLHAVSTLLVRFHMELRPSPFTVRRARRSARRWPTNWRAARCPPPFEWGET